MKFAEIIAKYTSGEATLEETNAKLEEAGAGFYLDPERHAIAPGEEARYGLLDTGTGSLDKVEIADGKVLNFGAGDMKAMVAFNGKIYNIQGDSLVE